MNHEQYYDRGYSHADPTLSPSTGSPGEFYPCQSCTTKFAEITPEWQRSSELWVLT